VGLTRLLVRAGAARPHVLVAAVPGGTAVRLAAEEQLRRRGWPAALTPADADVLLVAGVPAPGIAGAVEAAWAAVPAPRARAQVTSAGEVSAALDAARAELAAGAPQHLPAMSGGHDAHEVIRGGHGGGMGGMDMGMPAAHGSGAVGDGDTGHGVHEMAGGHDAMSGGHEGHGTGDTSGHDMAGLDMGHMDMDMGTPAGLPMARRGEDRDGLTLDRLHVPLGPLLPDWPAGLVIRLTMQGDVIQHAEAETAGVAADTGSFWTEPWRHAAAGEPVTTGAAVRRRSAAHLDSLARFLSVAGWDSAAAAARALRDDALGSGPSPRLGPAVRRLARRVGRSRVLAWSTHGMGTLLPGEAAATGMSAAALSAGGDVTARYRRWCRELSDVAAVFDDASPLDPAVLAPPRGRPDGTRAPSAVLLAALPRLLEGAEFAAARLIVASLDPDLDEVSPAAGAGHGH